MKSQTVRHAEELNLRAVALARGFESSMKRTFQPLNEVRKPHMMR